MPSTQILQEYIQSLQKQNQAKNQQRQTLYITINALRQQNEQFLSQLSYYREQGVHQQQYIQNILQELQAKQVVFNNLKADITMMQQQMNELLSQRQKLSHELENVINNLNQSQEVINKQQIEIQELTIANKRLQEQNMQLTNHNNQPLSQEIAVLIQNYEKIEGEAKQLQIANQILENEKQKVQQNLINSQIQLKKCYKQLKKSEDKFFQLQQYLQEIKISKQSQKEEINGAPSTSNLIKHNNQLIEKIISLEKQKNQLYYMLMNETEGHKKEQSQPLTRIPLQKIYAQNSYPKKQSQLKNKIHALQQQNQKLLHKLIIQ